MPGIPSHHDLVFTLRIDLPGTRHRDLQTAGGGHPRGTGLRAAVGEYRSQNTSTLVTYRDYLAGAVFTVAVQGPPPLLQNIADTLAEPHFSSYLGKRNCLPDEPLIIHTDMPDPVAVLHTAVPLSLPRPPAPGATHVPVTFVHEHPPAPGDAQCGGCDRHSTRLACGVFAPHFRRGGADLMRFLPHHGCTALARRQVVTGA
ncbi:hypothetical protein OG407_48595 [Streptomyces sp. NBC_01515]|uniref:type I-E CRISPR-associated protein Cas5/CasD n=1 Tax=Streptomyces sp. NBC_01515 TaxID=2903890 RepID=UPI003863DFA3